ncbi:MAG: hypothetical protein MUC49_06050 [Raineya sp.]|jgi:hypothetical protein|nr:hypothetical protein [Raineya sp.]
MSRSKKKTPIIGITSSETEKEDKKLANRKFRKVVKAQIKKEKDILALVKEVSNVWSFAKDGKKYVKNPKEKNLRK